jgi:deazaflavin-dependent oxidoreductase (nitroreductase family)
MNASIERRPPSWLRIANRLNIALLSHGIGPLPQRVLTIPGRKTGLPRRTPIAVVSLGGEEFLVAGYSSSDWVRNARAAGRGMLSRGSVRRAVELEEVPEADRAPILREFRRTVRGGRSFLTISARATNAELVAAAHEHPVFRIR